MKFASVRLKKSTIKPVLSFVFFSLCFVLLYLSYGRTRREGATRMTARNKGKKRVGSSDYSRPPLSPVERDLMVQKPMTMRQAAALGPMRGGPNERMRKFNRTLQEQQSHLTRTKLMPERDVNPNTLQNLLRPTNQHAPRPQWNHATQVPQYPRPPTLGPSGPPRPFPTSTPVPAGPWVSPTSTPVPAGPWESRYTRLPKIKP